MQLLWIVDLIGYGICYEWMIHAFPSLCLNTIQPELKM
jgi:hypothetical protein